MKKRQKKSPVSQAGLFYQQKGSFAASSSEEFLASAPLSGKEKLLRFVASVA
jgi:hypothetical protein